MADVVVESFAFPNYSGMLYVKGNTKTPLSSIIGGRRKYTDHVEFVTGQEYSVGGGSQPAISETASLTAPDATAVSREQKTNVTQIFHESVYISYAKQSNMGTLSGVNIANQVANPMNELDFQIAARMQKIANDIEYTFINGAYNKANSDATINKTRGLVAAVTTNVKAMSSAPLRIWDLAVMMQTMAGNSADISDLCAWVDATTMLQLNADAAANGLTIVPADRAINGIALSSVITPLGRLNLYLGAYLPAGTALILNLNVLAPVEQPVPGKGNFFLEPLAKVGAGEKYQIFGQVGLDHGPEWYHGKFTGIKQTFDPADFVKKVYVQGGSVASSIDTTTPLSVTVDNSDDIGVVIGNDSAIAVNVANADDIGVVIGNTSENPVPTQEITPGP